MNLSTKKIFNFTFFSLFFAFPIYPESQKSTVVVISGQRVMTESDLGKQVQESLQKKQQELTAPLQNKEKNIREIEKKLLEEKNSLEKEFSSLDKNLNTDDRLESLRERALKLEDDKRNLDRMVQTLRADAQKIESKLSEMYQKEMAKIDTQIKETIKELAQRFNWDVVLMEESVVYSNPDISKTNLVIEELNKKTRAKKLEKKQAIEKQSTSNDKKTTNTKSTAEDDNT